MIFSVNIMASNDSDLTSSNFTSEDEISSDCEFNQTMKNVLKRKRTKGSEGSELKRWRKAKSIQLERESCGSQIDKAERVQGLTTLGLTHKLKSNPKEALRKIG